MRTVVFILTLFISVSVFSQYPSVTIPGSETRLLESSFVKGQAYELQILLPGDYTRSQKKYPVVYLMDAQWDFPLVKSIYGQYYYDGFIPELIIVGVTWGGKKPNPDSLRARDYTPTNENRLIQSGGADQFLAFMKTELFPFIEKNYRVSNDDRILMGCSLGGLLTIYAMFTHTEMFNGYIAASPAIGWDNYVLYQYEKTFATKRITRPIRLYMTVGDVERGRPNFEKLSTFLIDKSYSNVNIHSKVLQNTGHSGTKSETYTRGLQYIFEKKSLALNNTELQKYTGTYLLPNGGKIELKAEENELYWCTGNQNKIRLLINTDTHLYATHEFFNLYFKIENGKIAGFDWARYGNNQFIKKIN